MVIHVANPIYDSVFKYLIEDERIAKTILSALLKKEVVDVKVRRHEYSNGSRDKISMFRIDFGAQIKETDGTLKLVLIELQKTWLETETLRFRQYLGAQYANPENILKDDNPCGFAIPMVTVYLLGHRVGDIKEPVVYVNHQSLDYNGNPVSEGMPDPFIESLNHNSIIVQIPLLHGQVNNRLEQVLSVFDQTRKDRHNRQVLNVEEDQYLHDDDMMYILRRLLAAASDSKLRQDMNVEDEYFSAIENRDTAIMNRDKIIAKQDAQINEQNAQISEQNAQINEQNAQISKQNAQINEQNAMLSEKDAQILKQHNQMRQLLKAMVNAGTAIEDLPALTQIDSKLIKELLDDNKHS